MTNIIKITVSDTGETGRNDDSGIIFSCMRAMITIDSNQTNPIALRDFNQLPSTTFADISSSQVIFFFEKENVITTLPETMNTNLINFFKNGKPKEKPRYCCINFASEMAYGRDVLKYDGSSTSFSYQDKSLFEERNLNPGDIIYLYNNFMSKDNFHFAVYIGQGYYLSLFGKTGPLIITDLDSIKKGFEAYNCVQAFKKQVVYQPAVNYPTFVDQFGLFLKNPQYLNHAEKSFQPTLSFS